MGTVTTTAKNAVHSGPGGNHSVWADSIAITNADFDAADIVRLCYVPAGTAVDRVVTKTTELDTHGTPTLTAKIGFTPVDGSAAVSGADTAISADAAFGRDAETKTFEIFPPYVVAVDSYLTLVFGTGAATEAATGTIYAKVVGETLGVS